MSPAPAWKVRPAVRADQAELAALVRELIQQLGDDAGGFDAARFGRDAFGQDPAFRVAVAADTEGRGLLGYALFHDTYEPSHAARGVYLCDLYVRPHARRRGIGRALVQAVAREAASHGGRFVWWITRGGDSARAFYGTLTPVREDVTAHALAFDAFDRLTSE